MINEVGASLPSHWLLPELAEVAVLVRGVSYKKEDATNGPAKGLVPILRATNISGSALTFDSLVYVPARYVSETQYIKKGDIVIASSSGSKDVVGKSGQVSSDLVEASFGAFCTLIRPDPRMDAGYLGLYFQSPGYREAISEVSAGSNINNIKSSELVAHRVPVPPRVEQARIVQKLEELLSDLDAGVAELKAAQRKLAQYRHSLLKAAVEGALTADWRAARARSGEPQETGADLLQRILTERRARWEAKQLAKYAEQGKTPPKGWQAKYPEPVTPNTEFLPTLPAGWVWASAEQLCDFITKGTTPPKGMGSGEEKGIPFLRVTNLTGTGELDFTDRVFVSTSVHKGFLARSVVYPNDVLMNIVGPPLGQVSIVPADFDEWNVNQAIAIFRPITGLMPQIIAACLLSTTAQTWLKARAKTTAGQTNLTLELCRELPLPLPPSSEQGEILTALGAGLSAVSAQVVAMNRSLQQAAAQRKNILKAAFAGQLVPQDPNDEPASALLERIQAERTRLSAARGGKRTGSNPAPATRSPNQSRRGRKPRTTA